MACLPPEKHLLQQFCEMMDKGSSCVASQYLSDDVVLDWYGRTVAGKVDVLSFLFREIQISHHEVVHVENPRPLARKDALLNAIIRANLKSIEESQEYGNSEDSGFLSELYETSSDSSLCSSGSHTPCSKITTHLTQLNINTPVPAPVHLPGPSNVGFHTPKLIPRPPKCMGNAPNHKTRASSWDPEMKMNFIEAKGAVSFSKYESLHNTFLEWTRDCRLQLGYNLEFYPKRTVTFSVLSYQDDMPCRRNLTRIFEEC